MNVQGVNFQDLLNSECKKLGLNPDEMGDIVSRLMEEDYFEFKESIKSAEVKREIVII